MAAYGTDERDMLIDFLEEPRKKQTNTSVVAPPRPGEMPTPAEPQTSSGGSGGGLMDVLGKYEYGPQGLLDAEADLRGLGAQIQKDSSGRARGRIKLANGDIVDVLGQGEGNDWWNNKTGSGWGYLNRGQQGLDAGGWSFTGGGGGGSLLAPNGGNGSSFGTIQSLAPTDNEFYNTLQNKIAEILGGPSAFDRDALLRMIGA
ncbi:MAG TPA: hypothetical protein VFZ53_14450 [Polyangiaceae bacterium]